MKTQKITAAFFLLLIVGCSSPGILFSRQEVDASPKMGVAPEDGNYGLFVAGQSQDLLEFPLRKDQPLGFRHEEQESMRWLYAVAGDEHVPLDINKTYEWRRQP